MHHFKIPSLTNWIVKRNDFPKAFNFALILGRSVWKVFSIACGNVVNNRKCDGEVPDKRPVKFFRPSTGRTVIKFLVHHTSKMLLRHVQRYRLFINNEITECKVVFDPVKYSRRCEKLPFNVSREFQPYLMILKSENENFSLMLRRHFLHKKKLFIGLFG